MASGKKMKNKKSTDTHTRKGNKKRKAFQSFFFSQVYSKQGYAILFL
jgi:hypothetical protein